LAPRNNVEIDHLNKVLIPNKTLKNLGIERY